MSLDPDLADLAALLDLVPFGVVSSLGSRLARPVFLVYGGIGVEVPATCQSNSALGTSQSDSGMTAPFPSFFALFHCYLDS